MIGSMVRKLNFTLSPYRREGGPVAAALSNVAHNKILIASLRGKLVWTIIHSWPRLQLDSVVNKWVNFVGCTVIGTVT
jgi:hypothetical protein